VLGLSARIAARRHGSGLYPPQSRFPPGQGQGPGYSDRRRHRHRPAGGFHPRKRQGAPDASVFRRARPEIGFPVSQWPWTMAGRTQADRPQRCLFAGRKPFLCAGHHQAGCRNTARADQ
jgi:Sulfite reductase, alpha subunit (flavoprotein)